MPNPTPKIADLEERRGRLVVQQDKLQRELDDAADKADAALVKQIQFELQAVPPMIASFDRRIAAARAADTESGRKARRDANEKALKAFAKELDTQRELFAPVVATIEQLVSQLEALKASGQKAQELSAAVVRQMPRGERQNHYSFMQAAGLQATMGCVLEDLLAQNGVFGALAPNSGVTLRRHGMPSTDEFISKRAEQLNARLRWLVERVNAEIE